MGTARRLGVVSGMAPTGAASQGAPGTMVDLPGGWFTMGSDRHYPEEKPARRVRVEAFAIDACPVTNAQFQAFVADTGYVTLAEKSPEVAAYEGVRPENVFAGSFVFQRPAPGIRAAQWNDWWQFIAGANWRHPEGAASSIEDRPDHPVVHVVHEDARTYAEWAGKALPTESEWEYAARGGLHGAEFAWGGVLEPGGRPMANVWQGEFPHTNLLLDGFETTSPVARFPPNGFGLYDMIGNVWEWTEDWYCVMTRGAPRRERRPGGCCAPDPEEDEGRERSASAHGIPRKVLKGGSFLCAPNYCRRYRPAARQAQEIDSSAANIGFRCVVRRVTAG
jgi:sulfatase modifying factor 1